jgi:hypothetical protein
VADIIITATGLVPFRRYYSIGFETFWLSCSSFVYMGLMISIYQTFIFVGYTNASWTLKSDLTSDISRMLFYLEKTNINEYKRLKLI